MRRQVTRAEDFVDVATELRQPPDILVSGLDLPCSGFGVACHDQIVAQA